MSKIPYNVLMPGAKTNSWDNVPRDPISIGAAIATATGLSVTAATILAYIGVSLVTSFVLSALAPKPKGFGGDNTSRGLLVNQKDGIAPHDFVYGEIRKGGTITYLETTGSTNAFLHQIIVLAGHEVEEIGQIYFNDVPVTLSEGDFGFVTTFPWSNSAGKRNVLVRKHLGSPGQSVDPVLLAESNQIDANFRGQGIAYLYIRYEYDQESFANGLPLVTAVVKGKKVFDPRTGITAYSNNAALCIRDYITSEYGLKDEQIDDVAFSVAANVCDENVILSNGGVEKRYTTNGVANALQSHGDILQAMTTSCAGSLFWGAGKWKLVVADYVAPTKSLDLNDLRGPINLSTRVNLQDQFNGVQGTFNNAANRWLVADYPPIKSPVFQAEDGGEETLLDFSLPFTTSAATAQRIAKLALFKGREQMTLTADFGLNAFDVEVGEIISFTNPRYGWDEKEFEVVSWSFGSAEAGDLRVTLTLRETSEAAFDWNAEEQEIISNNSNLPKASDAPQVGLSLDTELRVSNQQVVGVLVVDVTSNSAFVDSFDVQYKESSATEWVSLGQSSNGRFEILGVTDGLYDIRARAVTTLGVRGPFDTITNFYATLFEAPPETVTNFSANVVGNTLHLSWTPVGDLDLSHYRIRYSPKLSGAVYSESVDVIPKIARPATSAITPARTGTYFIKAVDKLGNESELPTTIITNVSGLDNFNVVETVSEEDTAIPFNGTKTNVISTTDGSGNDVLQLGSNSSGLFDSASGLFDDRLGLFDGGFLFSEPGVYEYAEVVDLSSVQSARVVSDVGYTLLDNENNFDDAFGLFDSRFGPFDGDENQYANVNVRNQISTTLDDPAGTPTWTEWEDFVVKDVVARGIRFRAILSSDSDTRSPQVFSLGAEVDMEDRVVSQDDLSFAAGTISVNFPQAFNVNSTPAVAVSLSGLGTGDYYTITNKDNTGFDLAVYDSTDTLVSKTIELDYVAKGYGRISV